jgi:adenosylcobinamide kinase/adenosylcobinamide-phosphate guanylyltransferase
VRIRRDPVTVIGDETHGEPLAGYAGKAWGVGGSESQETDPDGRTDHTGSRGRARAIARHTSHLILGGARSGKSRHALALAKAAGLRPAFVATAQGLDADMRARIARHRAERPPGWLTVEEPLALVAACRDLPGAAELGLIDCLTLWVGNRILRGDDETAIAADATALGALVAGATRSWLIVSNEVGSGVHPETAEGMRFRDALGLVNQAIAAAADRVTLMVAGLPVSVKGAPHARGAP